MKISIVMSVYNNEDNLWVTYNDLFDKVLSKIDYKYEIVMVNDGSQDRSYEVMKEIAEKDKNVKIISLSRNFGAHAAELCGLANSEGDAVIIKAPDNQEPSELIYDFVDKWKQGYNVVLAVRKGREEGKLKVFWANLYYRIVRKIALPNMPKTGFDTYLIDRKVVEVLKMLDEKNSSVTAQILWCGFRTAEIFYTRKAREIGKSSWTLRKKLKLVKDTVFTFSALPISIVGFIGIISFIISVIWGIAVLIAKIQGEIPVTGWTTLIILNLFSFGVIMFTLSILGEYLWRVFDESRNRPVFIEEDKNDKGI